MKQYLDLMRYVLENGVVKSDRTGTGTKSVFGYQMHFNLAEGFPLITTKKCSLRSIIHELLWFLKGDTNISYLKGNKVKIWDDWADENGELGPIYGHQWRSWGDFNGEGIDQISQVVRQIKSNPDSRRLIVSAWNVADLPDEKLISQENVKKGKMALAPCHSFFQFYVVLYSLIERLEMLDVGGDIEYIMSLENDILKHMALNDIGVPKGRLSCQMYQRSADIFLGVPFNIASYALLTMMMAQVCDLEPGEFIHTFGDAHLYLNHLDQARLQLSRDPYPLPKMKINPDVDDIFGFSIDDFDLVDYQSHPHIKAQVSI